MLPLTPGDRDAGVDFRFSSDAPGRMTHGEMLSHVAAHGAYHRGNIGLLLQKNGIISPPDRMTDVLEVARAPELA